jgi:hypothetical protein
VQSRSCRAHLTPPVALTQDGASPRSGSGDIADHADSQYEQIVSEQERTSSYVIPIPGAGIVGYDEGWMISAPDGRRGYLRRVAVCLRNLAHQGRVRFTRPEFASEPGRRACVATQKWHRWQRC